MIALILAIINLALEAIDISQGLGYIKVLIRIIEVVLIVQKIISYLGCNKSTSNTLYLTTIFIIPFYQKRLG
jgi:hypothetical protein